MKKSDFAGYFCSKDGFTLIELLVVVLIIGILAAVALPQYQKAVEKSRAVQAMILVKAIVQAGQLYFLEKGVYPTKFNDLDIQVPDWKGNKLLKLNIPTHTISDKDWNISLFENANNNGIRMERITGPYMGGAFQYSWRGNPTAKNLNQLLCIEEYEFYKNKQGSYCEKLLGGKKFVESTQEFAYTLP